MSTKQKLRCFSLSLIMNELLIFRDNGDIYPGFNGAGTTSGAGTTTGATSKGYNEGPNSDGGDFFGMIFKGSSSQAAPLAPYSSIVFVSTFLSLFIVFNLDIITNYDILLSLL